MGRRTDPSRQHPAGKHTGTAIHDLVANVKETLITENGNPSKVPEIYINNTRAG